MRSTTIEVIKKGPLDFVCGHETVGYIAALGDSVKNFEIGDHVVVPFSTACGDCSYCKQSNG
jgi:threonine dehydrogenase-like Zn-dependent dehydrogenase